MKKTRSIKSVSVLIMFTIFCLTGVNAQRGYAADSLQIKVYTEINYENDTPKAINIKKVFCDYCSVNQTKGIEDEALRRSYLERNLEKNRLVDGVKKLAVYIRIAKIDFAFLENNNQMSIENYLAKNMDTNTVEEDKSNESDIKTSDTRLSSN